MKKKISLPYYKDVTVFLNTVFKGLGYDVILLGKPTKETIEYALENSPEPWCFDLKLMLGQTVEGVEKGADIAMSPGTFGGHSQCSVGPYTSNLLKRILKRRYKKDINVFFFNMSAGIIIMRFYFPLFRCFYQLKNKENKSFFGFKLLKILINAARKAKLVSKFHEKVYAKIALVKEKQKPFLFSERFIAQAMDADLKTTKKLFNEYSKKLDALEEEKKKVMKIGLVGDVFSMLSQFPIFDLEKYLAEELNVHVIQPLSGYNYYTLTNPVYSQMNRKEVKSYFKRSVTGSDYLTILDANYLSKKVDGIIHLGVFGCTPEMTAMSILNEFKEKFPPVLNLTYGAHTQEEAIKVRVEAFVDMLKLKKQKK